jgi:ferric-dicitrate binding protein FerR (iron transport regulator)
MKDSLEVRIGRYLSGEMTDHEKGVFEQDLNSDTVLKEQYIALSRIWLNIPEGVQEQWDTEIAWSRFSASNPQFRTLNTKGTRRFVYWAAAAAVIVLLGTFALFFGNSSPVTYAYQEGISRPIILQDGSKVYLNKASDITVNRFSRKTRHIELEGEAYFEISPDPKRPFTIASGETTTEVVGTSFNIRQTHEGTTIYVHSGKVIFSARKDSKTAVALREGEAASFSQNRMEMIPNPSPNISAWRTGQLKFINMPLTEVIADISAYFDKEILIENESIQACRITRTLPKQAEIGAVLQSIALTINAKLVVEGNKYIIRGGSCS